MSTTLIIHTENRDKLLKIFQYVEKSYYKKDLSLYLHSKDYYPWNEDELSKYITSYRKYDAYPTTKSKVESVGEMLSKVKGNRVLIVDEDSDFFDLTSWNENNFSYLFSKKEDILDLNFDTKYDSLKWFIIDLMSQRKNKTYDIKDTTNDCIRYNSKIQSPMFNEKIIYIDGGMGDHVMALPLLERVQKDVYVCCKYPVVFEHLNIKGFVGWNDELFGGYRRFVYEYGSTNNSKTIIDAFFDMYGYTRWSSDKLIYNGRREKNEIQNNGKKIAVICTSAAKIQGLDSNKDWRDVRWFKLVHELKKRGYYVIQAGTSKDNSIPSVDEKFYDKPLANLASLVDECSLWLSVDTFFHHFASSIKPKSGICLTPFYNDHAKHPGVTYIEKDCGKNFESRKWWTDLQQPERKECMDLIQVEDVIPHIEIKKLEIGVLYNVDKHNIHLLEFSAKNSRTFSQSILVNFDDSDLENELKELKDNGIIDGFYSDDTDFKQMDFKLVLSADEFVEKSQVLIVVDDMYHQNISVGSADTIRYFKNLNHILHSENRKTYSNVLYNFKNGEGIKTYDYFKLHNASLTYDNKKDETFSEIFKTYYYNRPSNLVYNDINYEIKFNDINSLKIEGLVKVTCLSLGADDNCSNWRLFLPFDRFENGVNYELDSPKTFDLDRDRNVDVVIMGRPAIGCLDYVRKLKEFNVKVILDYDDVLPIVRAGHQSFIDSFTEILFMITECDMVLVTNDKLKYYFETHTTKPVRVFPNLIKDNLISEKPKENKDEIVVAWYGSGGHAPSLREINKDVLRILDDFDNVYFNLYTDKQEIADLFRHPKTRIINYNRNFYDFQNSLNDIDINLSPIELTYVNFCKSDIRIQLVAYKGIPSIATNFSEYRKFADYNGGAVVCDDGDWYGKIKELIIDEDKRNDIGFRAIETVKKHFNYKEWSKIKDETIINLVKNG